MLNLGPMLSCNACAAHSAFKGAPLHTLCCRALPPQVAAPLRSRGRRSHVQSPMAPLPDLRHVATTPWGDKGGTNAADLTLWLAHKHRFRREARAMLLDAQVCLGRR
jgi:hypothetical protein